MTLDELVHALPDARLVRCEDPGAIAISRVHSDSRAVEGGDLFVCVPGLRVDGHDFAGGAVDAGAGAVVVERELDIDVPQIVTPSSADALGVLSAVMAGRPADRLTTVGITGTNGKTTTTYLVEAILTAAGHGPGVIGTVSYRYGGREVPAPYTTPPPAELQRVFGDMAQAKCSHAVLEVSSAALSMSRMAGTSFQVAAFTNLTQDHLDVHGSMDAYRQAKARLFARHLADDGVAVINVDDPAAATMIEAAAGKRVLRVSTRGAEADVFAAELQATIEGVRAEIVTPSGTLTVESPVLLGHYNGDNITMAVAIAEALGIDHPAISRGIAELAGVPGRVERVANQHGLDILVDYAHTPDALDNVLSALRPLTRRRLICVFGCGGDRDPSKRPIMGQVVARLADLPVVTSDNPRTEEPQSIIDMILPAVPEPFFVDVDRRTAIRAAVAEATPGDVVLIAGKGHEDYQDVGGKKIHFDDREEAAAAAEARQGFATGELIRAYGELTSTTAEVVSGPGDREFSRIIIDGRTATAGDLYVAIRGANHDGHDFCDQAVAAGASGVVVAERARDRLPALGDATVISSEDPRQFLGAAASFHRARWDKQLIGVTGSAGKTTTKDLIAAGLGAIGRCHRSRGSLNNETGVPLTVLGLRPFHDYGVVEMGMRGLGQIAYLTELARPNVGVVVNAGVAHLGVLGSVEAIAQGKGEIFAGLRSGGCAVYPVDDQRLAGYAKAADRQLTFGTTDGADVRLVDYRPLGIDGSEIDLDVMGRSVTVRLALVGLHVALDAACAMAAAVALDADPEAIAHGMASAVPPALRGQLALVAERHLLIDCYNANPASTEAALSTLAELRGQASAFAVLGDMLELGEGAAAAHRQTGRHAADLGIAVIALGELRDDLAGGAHDGGGIAWTERDHQAAAGRALAESRPGDWILIKGSRGMKLENVVAALGKGQTD